MNDRDLETLLHDLKPTPLPDDLRKRLAAEPAQTQNSRKTPLLVLVSALAAVIVVFVGMMILFWSDQPTSSNAVGTAPAESASPAPVQSTASNETISASQRPVRVVKKDSTLLNSRLLAIEEYEGEFWEISEEEWQDETLVLYSGGPSKLNSTVIRREVVCSPATFQ